MARSAVITTPNNNALNTLAECKAHLRIEVDDDDTYITSLSMAAKQAIESYCNIIILDSEVKQYGDTWEDIYQLYFSSVKNLLKNQSAPKPWIEVDHIKYYDTAGSLQTWASTEYIVDDTSMPARIGLDPDGDGYPNLECRMNAIVVTYNVGIEFADIAKIPDALKQAGLILVGQWYENRQEAVVGRSVGVIPLTARYLMDPYRIQTFGLPTKVL